MHRLATTDVKGSTYIDLLLQELTNFTVRLFQLRITRNNISKYRYPK